MKSNILRISSVLAVLLVIVAATSQAAAVISWNVDSYGTITGANQVAGVVPSENFAFDDNGNRTGGNYQIGSSNRLAEDADGNTYEYDPEGNRIWKLSSDGHSKVTYDWDNRNRLAKVTYSTYNNTT
jgi:YD repeat-containing protein